MPADLPQVHNQHISQNSAALTPRGRVLLESQLAQAWTARVTAGLLLIQSVRSLKDACSFADRKWCYRSSLDALPVPINPPIYLRRSKSPMFYNCAGFEPQEAAIPPESHVVASSELVGGPGFPMTP